jgi:putative tryptophan/tyrosine transport system substrate-binding protein
MKKTITGLALSSMLLTLCFPVAAQQSEKVARIGFLMGASLTSQFARNEAFRQSLRELGYVEGKNIVIEWRSYEGKEDLRPKLAAELVRLKVDVIVAGGSGDIRAAREATGTIPIVMLWVGMLLEAVLLPVLRSQVGILLDCQLFARS